MIGAAALSVVSVWFGLVLSYHLGTAASATMALVPVVVFFLVLPFARWRRSHRTPDAASHHDDSASHHDEVATA
jgi:ABC-type Mn2+/Zn2+ transport system permease subunit